MAFTFDPTTRIGKVRLYSGEDDEETHVFEDASVQTFLDDAAGDVTDEKAVIYLAAYKLIVAKAAKLSALPNSQNYSTYSESTDLNSLLRLADMMKANLEDMGIALDGNEIAQFGHAEVARDGRSFRKISINKALRRETW